MGQTVHDLTEREIAAADQRVDLVGNDPAEQGGATAATGIVGPEDTGEQGKLRPGPDPVRNTRVVNVAHDLSTRKRAGRDDVIEVQSDMGLQIARLQVDRLRRAESGQYRDGLIGGEAVA